MVSSKAKNGFNCVSCGTYRGQEASCVSFAKTWTPPERVIGGRHGRGPHRHTAKRCDELATSIKKLTAHETAAAGLSSTEKPSSARRLTRRRACVSGRRRSK